MNSLSVALSRPLGVSLIVIGLLLLVGSLLYYAYGFWARSRLDEMNVVGKVTESLPDEVELAGFTPVPSGEGVNSRGRPADGAAPSPPEVLADPTPVQSQTLPGVYEVTFPGLHIHPKYWAEPLWAGADLRPATGLPPGYTTAPLDGMPADAAAVATRMRIPIINLDTTVNELGIVDLGDSLAYETPKNTVGHIPETVNPGQPGNGWFFGHLESPVRGEGNVFFHLPKIPVHLENGEPVYVVLETDNGDYLYLVSKTEVVHQDDLRLYDSEQPTITLVTCVPRLLYDHRLLVTARLVGTRR